MPMGKNARYLGREQVAECQRVGRCARARHQAGARTGCVAAPAAAFAGQVARAEGAFARQLVEQHLVLAAQPNVELARLDRVGQQFGDVAAHVGLDLRLAQTPRTAPVISAPGSIWPASLPRHR